MHVHSIRGIIYRKLEQNQPQNFSVARERLAAHKLSSSSTAKGEADEKLQESSNNERLLLNHSSAVQRNILI